MARLVYNLTVAQTPDFLVGTGGLLVARLRFCLPVPAAVRSPGRGEPGVRRFGLRRDGSPRRHGKGMSLNSNSSGTVITLLGVS